MSTNVIKVESVLTRDEYDQLDRFCGSRPDSGDLSDIKRFLEQKFGIELTLDPDVISGFVSDSSNLPGHATGLCRPSTERECSVIFRACFAVGIPITVSAGRSNLTGSATPEEGIVVSTVNMRSPATAVDMDNMTVVSSPGIILEELRNEVLALTGNKLIYPVDPTSRSDASVGGAIACNASGFTPGEAGAMRPWVEAVDFMLPNGLLVRAERGQYMSSDGVFVLNHNGAVSDLPVPVYHRPNIKNAGGPWSSPSGVMDFVDFVVGSEGIFGMVTACRLKLAERPADYLDLFFTLAGEAEVLAFLGYLRGRLNGTFENLTALEYFGVNCRAYMDHESALFAGSNRVGINVQVPLFQNSLEDAAEEWLEILLESNCGIDEQAILILDNDRVRNIFIEARHSLPANALEQVKQRGGFTIMTDTVVPFEHFGDFLEYAHGIIGSEGIDYVSFGHLGDCHIHFTLLPDKDHLERAREIYDMIVAKSADLGGVYSGEHGTGKRKRQDFVRCYGVSAVDEIRRCKSVLDPRFLLNRENVIEKS